MNRPRLLDLFCGAGGCSVGYHRAGFDVVGVDLKPMPRYPFTFHQADALEFLAAHGHEFDAIHAWPPCQGYSRMRHLPWLKDREYPMLIPPTRAALELAGRPWVMENVEDAPMENGIVLCGFTLGLKVYRHRQFESNIMLLAPPHRKHTEVIGSGRMLNDRAKGNDNGFVSLPSKVRLNKPQNPDGILSIAGHNFPGGDGPNVAMGIDWMTRQELTQAIPPAYTEYIGRQLLQHVRHADAVESR